jgi:PKD repeat protein
MGDKQEAAAEPKKGFGWLKAIGGGIGGLVSGAIMMYASPLVDKFVKPAKPVANFEKLAEGTTITFHNRSTGATDGWWDFGDGTALEPYMPHEQSITHTFGSPGKYTVKLSLHNLVGEQDERSVSLDIDQSQSTAAASAPSIDQFDVIPMSPGCYVPATFRIVCKVKNVQTCIWSMGDDRPWEIATDASTIQDRIVTFNKPGGYEIRLVAVNGKQVASKSDIAQVDCCPKEMITAVITTTDQANHVESLPAPYTFAKNFPPDAKEDVHPFDYQAFARPGYEIADVRLGTASNPGPGMQGKTEMAVDAPQGCNGIRNLRLQISADRKSVHLTGEMAKSSSFGQRNAPLPKLLVPVVLMQEKKSAVASAPVPVAAAMNIPGMAVLTLPSVPADWKDVKRQVRVELRYGDQVLWHDTQLPHNAAVKLGNGTYVLTATPKGNQVRFDLVKPSGAAGN